MPRYRRPSDPPSPSPKPRELAALVAEWDAKLAADGFRDIETRGEPLLKDARHRDAHERQRLEEGAAYLDACRDYLRAPHVTLRKRDRRIWRLHSQGKTVREIARNVGCSKSWVDKRVAHIRVRMLRWRKVYDRPSLRSCGVMVGVRLPSEQAQAVKEFADAGHITTSEAIRAMVSLAVNHLRNGLRSGARPSTMQAAHA